MRASWRTLKASALALVGILAVPAGVAVPAPAEDAAAQEVRCAWPGVVRPSRLNIAFPETNATYWMMPYRVGEGERLVVDGTYPSARFTSLTVYDAKGSPIDSLADYEIAPSRGSKNPFAVPDAGTNPDQHRYRVTVQPGAAVGAGDNTLAATKDSAASGLGWLVLRIYVPAEASDPTGGVPLPALSRQREGSNPSAIPTCSRAGAAQGPDGPVAEELRELVKDNAPPGGFEGCGESTVEAPGFAIPNKVGGLFPNPYNKYLCSPLAHESGRIAVIRGQAPTFPNTGEGQSVLDKTQLRYWSICQNQWQLPYPASSCAADFQTALDKDRRYTYVVSTKQDRPANATEDNGVTWIDWGPTNVNSVLLFRNMLPARDFAHAVQDVPSGQDPATVMDAYYPTVTYCTKTAFAEGGPDACPAS
ncbi:hypothetical protein I2W78_24650 [Streptomyces spinoverrucosus]|uniref:hypothetical protein n=1 Tax=Streptomyces spinoverrucosus TaxID=284043 RepID=UPI0018C4127E|nr:hypothetical protein [Streptomyces spinoverrucosus]MBG0854947.1 hypothetical protein [Streptomyces spinoverrucosus]